MNSVAYKDDFKVTVSCNRVEKLTLSCTISAHHKINGHFLTSI